MAKYIITGRILPERVSYSYPNSQTLELPEIGNVIFTCDSSMFTVIIDNTEISERHAFIFSKHFASIFVNSFCLLNDYNYKVEPIQIINQDNKISVYGVTFGTEYFDLKGLKEIDFINLSNNNFSLRFSIKDYLDAGTADIELAFLCYRAIETIKQYFTTNNNDKKGWKLMHESIGSKKEDIIFIKSYADPIRHGNTPIETTNAINLKILSITKEIIILFASYLQSLN